jgi:leader peptidase (prepilin peptidase)/N-methyltransferase
MTEALIMPLGPPWLAALFGLILGSFLNVCISRLPDDYSVVVPRSHCPKCGAWIAWYDNIPLVSYLVLGGKCRACHQPISWRYPAVEALTGFLFYLATSIYGVSWAGLKWSILGAWLVALIFSDLETRVLPDEFTMSGIALGLMLAPVVPLPPGLVSFLLPAAEPPMASFVDALVATVGLAGGLFAMGWAYQKIRGKEGLGLGDVKMLALLGAFLGLEHALLALILGSVFGTVAGLAWIKLRGEDPSQYELPFGSFLGAAGLVVAFAGAGLFTWPR